MKPTPVPPAAADRSSLQWTPDLSVGVAELDEQHAELFRRAERLVHALVAGDRSEVDPLVHSLSDYLSSHLEFEERRMSETRYPGQGSHQDAHWRFKDEVAGRALVYRRRGPSPAMARAIQTWLAGWLRPHLGGADLALGRWLGLRPVGLEPWSTA